MTAPLFLDNDLHSKNLLFDWKERGIGCCCYSATGCLPQQIKNVVCYLKSVICKMMSAH